MKPVKKILVVEDNPDNAQLLEDILGAKGYDLTIVDRGDRALDEVSRIKFDIVLLDIQLPDTDGLNVVKKIRENPETNEIPVIAVTAYGEDFQKEAAIEAGFDEYITKPIKNVELVKTVEQYAGKPD
jgi:two-component system cell cycle response regulator DivK